MTPPLHLVGGDTIVISATQGEVIRTCAKMWAYRYLHRRVPTVPNEAAQGGKAFDSALNLRYLRCGSAPVDSATEQEMLAMIDKAYEGVELPLEEFRTPARYKEVVQAYNQHYGREPWEVLGVQVPFKVMLGEVTAPEGFWHRVHAACQHDFKETPAAICPSEVSVKCRKCHGHGWKSDFDLRGHGGLIYDYPVRVVFQGLLDLYVRLGEHILVVDTKTSKSDIDGSYDNSAQMKGYMWAMQELARLYPDKGFPPKVHGALINGVVIRPPYKNEARTPKANDKPRNQFTRSFPAFYSEERLEEWRHDTLFHVEQALQWVARDHFPANERHCTFHVDAAFTNYGTYGKPCPFLGVCTLPAAQREMMLATDAFMDYERGPLGESTPASTPAESPKGEGLTCASS